MLSTVFLVVAICWAPTASAGIVPFLSQNLGKHGEPASFVVALASDLSQTSWLMNATMIWRNGMRLYAGVGGNTGGGAQGKNLHDSSSTRHHQLHSRRSAAFMAQGLPTNTTRRAWDGAIDLAAGALTPLLAHR